MTGLAAETGHGEPRGYHTELAVLAQGLSDLWIGCGRPSMRGPLTRSTGLAPSVISDAMNGKHLPSRDNLICIVRALLTHETGAPVDDGDPRVRRWRSRWEEVARLRVEHQRRHGSLKQPPPTTRSAAPMSRSLPPTATISDIDAAQGAVKDDLSQIDQLATAASQELLVSIDARDQIADEIADLKRQLRQKHIRKDELRREIVSLEQERDELNQRIAHLRQELMLMREDRLGLVEEESELNDRRARLFFEWARSEEAKNAVSAKQLEQLSAQLTTTEAMLKAADQLILRLRPPETP
ncbi:hypothetical protein [Streptomyces albipurpureus]|uniref:Uncharacterized protein n=1 Tax=Streptomyces albipurpureus TaxID=2897419 RepID=A0ABT0ULT7_9ACTN|nr:hypothetical protein [Streptomyces sp. CWNU-1]MCM2389578.1 hypothetical protein [Streptomyces sp. CWNU-1]